jgi:hypothetical protein
VDFSRRIAITTALFLLKECPMGRVCTIACLAAVLVLGGCQTIDQRISEVKHSLEPEGWFDEHPIARGAVTAAIITGAVVGVVAVVILVDKAEEHTNRGMPREASPPQP